PTKDSSALAHGRVRLLVKRPGIPVPALSRAAGTGLGDSDWQVRIVHRYHRPERTGNAGTGWPTRVEGRTTDLQDALLPWRPVRAGSLDRDWPEIQRNRRTGRAIQAEPSHSGEAVARNGQRRVSTVAD